MTFAKKPPWSFMSSSRIVYLRVTTYTGVLGAYEGHYYGRFYPGHSALHSKSKELTYPLSAREAAKRNKASDWAGWKKGDLVNNFDSRPQLMACAIASFPRLFPNALYLIEGTPASVSPNRVLVGDGADDLNRIYQLYDQPAQIIRTRGTDVEALELEWQMRFRLLFDRARSEAKKGRASGREHSEVPS